MPNIFDADILVLDDLHRKIKNLPLKSQDEQNQLKDVNELINSLNEALRILSGNFELIKDHNQPDITYRLYAASVVQYKEILPSSYKFLVQKFPNFEFKQNQKLQQLKMSFDLLNQRLSIKQKQRDPSFLDTLINKTKFISQQQIKPPALSAQLRHILINEIAPHAASKSMYATAICVGKAFEQKLGEWQPGEQIQQQKQQIVDKVDKEASVHIVLGRLFFTFLKNPLFNEQLCQSLKLARLITSIQTDGELHLLAQKSKNLVTTSFKALSEYLNNLIVLKNEGQQQKIPFRIIENEKQQLKLIVDTLVRNPQLQEVTKLQQILEDYQQKLQNYFEDLNRFRSVVNLIYSQFTSGQQLSFKIQCVEDLDQQQLKNHLNQVCYLKSMNELLQQFTAFNKLEKSPDKLQEKLSSLEMTQQEVESSYQLQLFTNRDFPKNFKVTDFVNQIKQKCNIKLYINSKLQKSIDIGLEKCIEINTTGTEIRLGCDLSSDLVEPFSVFQKLKSNSVKVVVQTCGFSQEINLQLQNGESTSSYDVSTQNMEFTLGYFMNVRGLENKGQTKHNYVYDPNMCYKLQQQAQIQNKQKEEEVPKFTRYRGGNFQQFREAVSEYYELKQGGNQQTEYDAKDYVNLIDKAAGKQMLVLDEKKQFKSVLKLEQKWFALDCIWRDPDNNPLFFSQYLAAMNYLYQQLFKMQAQGEAQLQILWIKQKWENPFIPRPILFRGRELYPARISVRPKGQDLYKAYVQSKNQEIEQEEELMKNLTQNEFIQVNLLIESIQPVTTNGNEHFVIYVKLTGDGTDAVPSALVKPQMEIVKFDQMFQFNAPLPVIMDQKGEKIGYDESEEALAQLPYALKIICYLSEDDNQLLQLGSSIVIPLRSVFLQSEIRSEITLKDDMKLRLSCGFSPPKIPGGSKPGIYFCNVSSNGYSRELPSNINTIIKQIQQIPTRTTITNKVEMEMLKQLQTKQQQSYLKKYAVQTPYFKRGISLFVQTLQNEMLMINDFLMPIQTCQQLCDFLQIRSVVDAVQFAISIPFVPDAVARYYTKQEFMQPVQETRLVFEQVLQLSGGDYFEHACLLQGCIQACGFQAFVCRCCTSTLTNEYFVLCMKQDEIVLIDPVNGRGYLVFKQNVEVQQSFVTKLIMVFDQKQILINIQPDLTPSFTDFDFNDSQKWLNLQHQSIQSDFDFKKYFYEDEIVNDVGQKEAARKEELQILIKEQIRSLRGGAFTNFNEVVEQQLQQGNRRAVENMNFPCFELECAFEDSASLIERISDSAIFMGGAAQNFAVYCSLKAFGLKFGFIRLEIYRLVQKSQAALMMGQRGTKFGIGW